MNWPWWLTWWGWWGYWVAFKASFGAGYRGGSREQYTQAGLLAAYQAARQRDPSLRWDEWWAATHPHGKPPGSPRDPLS